MLFVILFCDTKSQLLQVIWLPETHYVAQALNSQLFSAKVSQKPGLLTRDTKPKYRLLYYRGMDRLWYLWRKRELSFKPHSQNRREQNKEYCLFTNITHTLILSKVVFLSLYIFPANICIAANTLVKEMCSVTAVQRVKGLHISRMMKENDEEKWRRMFWNTLSITLTAQH